MLTGRRRTLSSVDSQWAERIGRETIETVKAAPGVGEWRVPRGFELERVDVETTPNPFSGLDAYVARVTLSVPLVDSYTTELCAHLPADPANLEE